MPNYSHGTKLTLASAEEPPYLTVGTDVSAKYKGAFCEAKITDVNKHVKCRVIFDGSSGSYLIDDTDLKQGSTLSTGTRVEAKHPEKTKQQTYVQATISKIIDHSRYTVVFDDGDQCILRRNSICLKSGKHFAESETLDQLPLTNPEHFGNPVKVGAIGSEHLSTNSSSHITTNNLTNHQQQQNNNTTTSKSHQTNNHLLLNDKPRGKSSSSTTNSSSTTSEDTKSNASETVTNNRKRQYNNQDSINDNTTKRLKKERNQNNTDKSTSTATATARRGSTKGAKRRESINNGSKNAMDLDDNSLDSSIESGDVDPAETNVKYELIEVGVKLMVQYGKGKVQNVYEAKVNKIETNNAGKIRYFVHYTGWNNRYDEWITRNRIHSIVIDKENGAREGKAKHSETAAVAPATNSNTNSISSNSTTTVTPKTEPKEKEPKEKKEKEKEKEVKEKDREKDKEKEKPTRTRRARQSEAPTNATTNSSSKTSSASSSTNSVVSTNSTISTSSTASLTASTAATSPATSTLAISAPVQTTSVSSSSVGTAPAVASTLTAPQTTQAVVESNRKNSTAAVTLPLTQTTVSSSKATSTPKAEPKEKEKDEKPTRTRRAKQSEALTNNTPVAPNCTQNAPSSNNSVTNNSSISIATTAASVTNSTVATTSTITTTPVAATPVTTTPVTTARTAQSRTTVDSTKYAPSKATTDAEVSLPTTEKAAPADKVKDSNHVLDGPSVRASETIDGHSDDTKAKDSNSVNQHPPVANDSGPTYRFCDEIDESDCDKKISILQDRIMALRQTYTALKTELADLDRRKKRPRTERSNSDHISNCSVVCRS